MDLGATRWQDEDALDPDVPPDPVINSKMDGNFRGGQNPPKRAQSTPTDGQDRMILLLITATTRNPPPTDFVMPMGNPSPPPPWAGHRGPATGREEEER